MAVDITPGKPAFDSRLKDVLALVKGRHVQFDLLVGGMKPSDPAGDERAARVLREMSGLTRDSGSRFSENKLVRLARPVLARFAKNAMIGERRWFSWRP